MIIIQDSKLQSRIQQPGKGGPEKHEICAAAFGSHLFCDLFSQGRGPPRPLPLDPLLKLTWMPVSFCLDLLLNVALKTTTMMRNGTLALVYQLQCQTNEYKKRLTFGGESYLTTCAFRNQCIPADLLYRSQKFYTTRGQCNIFANHCSVETIWTWPGQDFMDSGRWKKGFSVYDLSSESYGTIWPVTGKFTGPGENLLAW